MWNPRGGFAIFAGKEIHVKDSISLASGFLAELEAEASSTRKCLERIPESLFGYKPHERSMQLGYLAKIIAEIPLWVGHMVTEPGIDYGAFERPEIKTTAELVAYFDANMEKARNALKGATNAVLDGPFELKNNGKLLMTLPRSVNISSSINHLVHHRGQLTVYMRLNNIPVPSIYGPSADDRGF
jgi:uncharacterized damage-inducible protein DinB